MTTVQKRLNFAQAVDGVRDVTTRQVPNLAARLSAPSDAPRKGFTSIHGAETNVEASIDFDAASPSEFASNQPASDAPPSSDAGDTFPGDLLPAGETEAASPDALSDEPGLAVDVIAWADKLIDDLPFLKPEKVAAVEADRRELAKFAILKTTDMAKARELEAALQAAKES
jgi:hypothetical protein